MVRWGLVAVVVVLAGCGSTMSPAAAAANQTFLSTVHANAPDVGQYRSDQSLIRLGHAACDGFRGGASYEQLADRLALEQGSHSLPTPDLGAVVSAAVNSYCPQYSSQVQ